MQFSVYQQSDIGGRKVNQDRMGYCYTREALLLVLADGMGGHLRGEVAATIVMQTMSALFKQQAAPIVKNPARFLEDACNQAHAAILRYAAERDLPDTPRTTVVACLVQHDSAVWAHCGDSRLYLVRRGQVLARTRDHSHIEFLIERGQASPAERSTHPDRNKLYNCLGAGTPPKVEISPPVRLQGGDVLMLCSDGLWSPLPDAEIAHRLGTGGIASAVPELVGMATAIAGSKSDNTTALAITWRGAETPAAGEAVVSTMMLAADEVNTTIAATPEPLDESADVFDEDEIEKAIAEIRDAIEKSSQLLK